MKTAAILLLALLTITTHVNVHATDDTCSPDQKGGKSCVEKSALEVFTQLNAKLASCLSSHAKRSPTAKAAAKECANDPTASKTLDCFYHCVWTNLGGFTPLLLSDKAFVKEDFNVLHGFLAEQFNETVAHIGTAIHGRCKPLLQDDPLFPPMERCAELNGFYRCTTFNFLKELGCEMSVDERKIIGVLDLTKLNRRRK